MCGTQSQFVALISSVTLDQPHRLFGDPAASFLNKMTAPQTLFQLPYSVPGSVASCQPVLEVRVST